MVTNNWRWTHDFWVVRPPCWPEPPQFSYRASLSDKKTRWMFWNKIFVVNYLSISFSFRQFNNLIVIHRRKRFFLYYNRLQDDWTKEGALKKVYKVIYPGPFLLDFFPVAHRDSGALLCLVHPCIVKCVNYRIVLLGRWTFFRPVLDPPPLFKSNGESSSARWQYRSRMKDVSFCFEKNCVSKIKPRSFSSGTSAAT